MHDQQREDFFAGVKAGQQNHAEENALLRQQRLETAAVKEVFLRLGYPGNLRQLADQCQQEEGLDQPRITLRWLSANYPQLPIRLATSPVPDAHLGAGTFWEMLDNFKKLAVFRAYQAILDAEGLTLGVDRLCLVFRREMKLVCFHNYPHNTEYVAGTKHIENSGSVIYRRDGMAYYLERFSVLLGAVESATRGE